MDGDFENSSTYYSTVNFKAKNGRIMKKKLILNT